MKKIFLAVFLFIPITALAYENEYFSIDINDEYNEVIDFAAELGIVNAFVQEGDAAEESFIPDFDKNNI